MPKKKRGGSRKSLKFPRAYDAMRKKGYSKEKAARISNWLARTRGRRKKR